MRFKINNKKLEVHYSIFDIGASWDYDFIPAYQYSMHNIDQYFVENGENISSVLLEISKGREFMLHNAYQLAKIINENKPKNRIDWKATFRYCNLGEYNPLGWKHDYPISNLILKGYSYMVKINTNSYKLMGMDFENFLGDDKISLTDPMAYELLIQETMGLVEIHY